LIKYVLEYMANNKITNVSTNFDFKN